jgi:hypothetical protein
VTRLSEAAQTDWKNSHKLDLTDAGLLEDPDTFAALTSSFKSDSTCRL